MRIAIVGAGNAGCAHAFKLAEGGHKITLVKTSHTLHEDNFDAITKNGGIWGVDSTNGNKKSFQKIALITRNIKEGIENAEFIMVLTQSLQHPVIAQKVASCITDKTKMILLIPGNLGSLFFYKELNGKNIILSEGESTPYDARIIDAGVVHILFKNVRNALAFLPIVFQNEGIKMALQLVDTYKFIRKNIVESALHNPNLVVHTVGVIMSASRIEMTKGEFWMYKESFSPSIWNLIEELDKEKNIIIEIFGGEKTSYLDACRFRNETNLSRNSMDVFNDYANKGGPKGPDSLNTRYLYEDVHVGLCLLSMLGEKYNVKTPVADSLITIASSLLRYDFKSNARTLEDFGIENMSNAELINFVNT